MNVTEPGVKLKQKILVLYYGLVKGCLVSINVLDITYKYISALVDNTKTRNNKKKQKKNRRNNKIIFFPIILVFILYFFFIFVLCLLFVVDVTENLG